MYRKFARAFEKEAADKAAKYHPKLEPSAGILISRGPKMGEAPGFPDISGADARDRSGYEVPISAEGSVGIARGPNKIRQELDQANLNENTFISLYVIG